MKYFTFYCLFILSLLLLSPLSAKGNTNCVGCHQQAVSNWQQSDHAKAMDVAETQTVLGDFSGVEVTHYTQVAKFYQKDQGFYIHFTEAGESTQYRVKYTFGHYPLQQYLIEGTDGKVQVFPFAWDSRVAEDGACYIQYI